jgi:3-deoxy-manno-octulosonate cytidylyltransferase (CMP-KDO synthetase)
MSYQSKIIGVVPARMASSRFPGKPLFNICGRPMVEHVLLRGQMFSRWDAFVLATCDSEIEKFGLEKNFSVVMTSDKHTRALDRVAEAAELCTPNIKDQDIVVCVQGDEPMMQPDMIDTVIKPLEDNPAASCAILAMEISDEVIFRNPDTLKIVHDLDGRVLYTSRTPIPYCAEGDFSSDLGARRIYGILAFRWHSLKWYNTLPESPLELSEACDSNRICDNGGGQLIAPYPSLASFSVDSLADRDRVEVAMENDPYWGKY